MAYQSGYQGNFNPAQSTTIAAAATTSAEIPTGGLALCGIKFPPTFTGTTVTFVVCDVSGGTFIPLYNSAGAVSYTIAQNRFYAIDPKDFQGVAFFKIVSGSTEGSTRTLALAMKGF